MNWDNIKRKLTSRKLWMAVASFVSLIIVALKGTEEVATQVTAIIMAAGSVIAYIVGEGFIDAASAGKTDNIYIDGVKVTEENTEE